MPFFKMQLSSLKDKLHLDIAAFNSTYDDF